MVAIRVKALATWLSGLTFGLTAQPALAQVPDVRLKFDLGIYTRLATGNQAQFRTYDTLGRPSIVSLTFFLESGLRAYTAQRFERIVGSGDTDFIDELYIEDEGSWRLGKQYLPFGYGRILAESAVGARADSSIVLDGVPIAIGFCDNGTGFQRGVFGRIGRPGLNAFAASGRHFGISGTGLTVLRRPEDAGGKGRGYEILLGLEATRRIGIGSATATIANYRKGESVQDPDFLLVDVAYITKKLNQLYGAAGITYGSNPNAWLFRLGGGVSLDTRTDVEPMIRFKDGRFHDFTVGVRFRF
jgi:hypothetical protein